MEEPFIVTVEHKGKELHLETQFQPWGYTHRFKVMVQEVEVYFEPDEEGNYRATLPDVKDEKLINSLDRELLQNIADTIKAELS